MQVLLLGPVAVTADGRGPTHLPGSKQSALLTALALAAGQVLDRDELVDVLWGSSPPSTARNTLQAHVSGVRRQVGTARVERVGTGYRLALPTSAVDALELASSVERAEQHLARGEHAAVGRLVQSGLALWRGTPFPELAGEWFDAERQRLERLRERADLLRLDADLELGRHRVALDDLQRLTSASPLDEGLAERLMLALYRSGRQVEALEVYGRIRDHLLDQLGVEPGPGLRRRHHDVLNQSPDLHVPDTLLPTLRPWRGGAQGPPRPILGRDALVQRLLAQLRPGLVATLVGPSGVGKSRLAREVVRRAQSSYSGGGVVVAAATLHTPAELWTQVQQNLDADQQVTGPGEARELVARGDVLLVLDDPPIGSEALADVACLVADGEATVLVTSPRPTGIDHEEVVPVPALGTGADEAGVELLLRRARAAGADLGHDAETLHWASRCVELVEGLPLAIELIAPAAVLGLEQLAQRLERDSVADVGGMAMSFASSLDRLDDRERDLLDALGALGGPVDLPVLLALGLPGLDPGTVTRAVASLVRDGLVLRQAGTHGHPVFSVGDTVAAEVRARQSEQHRAELCRHALLALGASLGGTAPWIGPAFATSADSQRALAHRPALAVVLPEAREHGLALEAAPLLVLMTAVHYGQRGVDPEPRRLDWVLAHDGLPDVLRYDVLMAAAHAAGSTELLGVMAERFTDALALAQRMDDADRAAVVIALANLWSVIVGTPLLRPDEERRAWLERAEDPLMRAAALGWGSAAVGDVDGLSDALRDARGLRHEGVQMFALINTAEIRLEQEQLDDAAVCALEAAAMASRMHQEFLVTMMNATATSARAVAGDRPSMQSVARMVGLALESEDFRTATLGLLKLAAGAHRTGREDLAAECLAAYGSTLARHRASPTQPERALIARYLAAYDPDRRLEEPLDRALPRLLADFTATD